MLPGGLLRKKDLSNKGRYISQKRFWYYGYCQYTGKTSNNLVKTLNFNLKEERKLEKEKQNLIAKKEDTEKKQKTETDMKRKKTI